MLWSTTTFSVHHKIGYVISDINLSINCYWYFEKLLLRVQDIFFENLTGQKNVWANRNVFFFNELMRSNHQIMNSESTKKINEYLLWFFFSTGKLKKKLFWTYKKFLGLIKSFFFSVYTNQIEKNSWKKFVVWCFDPNELVIGPRKQNW